MEFIDNNISSIWAEMSKTAVLKRTILLVSPNCIILMMPQITHGKPGARQASQPVWRKACFTVNQ